MTKQNNISKSIITKQMDYLISKKYGLYNDLFKLICEYLNRQDLEYYLTKAEIVKKIKNPCIWDRMQCNNINGYIEFLDKNKYFMKLFKIKHFESCYPNLYRNVIGNPIRSSTNNIHDDVYHDSLYLSKNIRHYNYERIPQKLHKCSISREYDGSNRCNVKKCEEIEKECFHLKTLMDKGIFDGLDVYLEKEEYKKSYFDSKNIWNSLNEIIYITKKQSQATILEKRLENLIINKFKKIGYIQKPDAGCLWLKPKKDNYYCVDHICTTIFVHCFDDLNINPIDLDEYVNINDLPIIE